MNETNKSTADQMRAALKSAGYSRKQVTVKHDHYSMGSSVRVTIRCASIPKSAIAAICDGFESVRRDESGDILSGGNRFVTVEYADSVIDALARPVAARLAEIAATAPNTIHDVEGRRVTVMRPDAASWHWVATTMDELCSDGRRLHCFAGGGEAAPAAEMLMHAARQLVEARIERECAPVAENTSAGDVTPTAAIDSREDWSAGL